jgi:ribokinase
MNILTKPILVVGSLNMDLVVTVAELPEKGETIFGKTFTTFPGGKGGNQAVSAARLGANVTMVGAVGRDDFGEKLLYSLSKSGVDTSHINLAETFTGTALITVDQNGANSIVVVPGANEVCCHEDIDSALQAVAGPGILLVQNEIPEKTVEYALQAAKEKGWTTILNPAPARMIADEILSMIDIIIPNETEVAVLTGCKTGAEERAAQVLLDRGAAAVIITLGSKGALYCTAAQKHQIPSYKVNAVDTTAAGDAYVGALATALSEGRTVLESAKFAAAVGALAVTKPGAQPSLPWREEVDEFIGKQEGQL